MCLLASQRNHMSCLPVCVWWCCCWQIFAEKDAKSARAYATRLCAQSITSQAIHYVVSKHVGRFYGAPLLVTAFVPNPCLTAVLAHASTVAATEAQRSAETRVRLCCSIGRVPCGD